MALLYKLNEVQNARYKELESQWSAEQNIPFNMLVSKRVEAEKAYEKNPTPENKKALEEAQKNEYMAKNAIDGAKEWVFNQRSKYRTANDGINEGAMIKDLDARMKSLFYPKDEMKGDFASAYTHQNIKANYQDNSTVRARGEYLDNFFTETKKNPPKKTQPAPKPESKPQTTQPTQTAPTPPEPDPEDVSLAQVLDETEAKIPD